MSAELGLVFLNVVQTLDFVVRVYTIFIGARLVRTEVKSIVNKGAAAATIQLPVKLRTLLGIMGLLIHAFGHFKHLQIQVLAASAVGMEQSHSELLGACRASWRFARTLRLGVAEDALLGRLCFCTILEYLV